jgi:hypothetical protein
MSIDVDQTNCTPPVTSPHNAADHCLHEERPADLGDRFPGHVERCRVLPHLVEGTSENVGEAYKIVRAELAAADAHSRPQI